MSNVCHIFGFLGGQRKVLCKGLNCRLLIGVIGRLKKLHNHAFCVVNPVLFD